MTEFEASGVSWWLWPNVLAFDAPLVAVVWQRFLADVFGVALSPVASVVLGLVVWGIYLADRLLDAQRSGTNQPRHRFAAKHSKLVASLALLSFLVAGVLAVTLPALYISAGGIVAVLVAGYLGLVHLVKASLDTGKEVLVGLLFAAGVAIPLIASEVNPQLWLPTVGSFALACWLNCRLIEVWEVPITGVAIREVFLGCAILVCATVCPRSVALALGTAAGLLLTLHLLHRRIGLQPARVLADVALLTPLIAWFVSS